MAMQELACPTCDADIPLVGDERVGHELFCPFCGAPAKITAKTEEVIEIEEDY